MKRKKKNRNEHIYYVSDDRRYAVIVRDDGYKIYRIVSTDCLEFKKIPIDSPESFLSIEDLFAEIPEGLK